MPKLKRSDFKIFYVSGDGNCGPRAISVGIYGTEDYHQSVRSDVYKYMLDDYTKRGGVAKAKDTEDQTKMIADYEDKI